MALASSPLNHKAVAALRKLAVVPRRIADLVLDPQNPRIHTKKQILQIARSIRAFGFIVPVLVDRNFKVIAGHGRVFAAEELGMTEVPVIQVEHLTKNQAQAFMIADNRLTEIAAWDDRLLGEHFKALAEVDLDFSLEVTGFSMGEIDLRIEGLNSTPSANDDPADALVAPGPRVSQLGDLWLLEKSRVLCADSLQSASFKALLQGETAAAAFVDPPYNVKIDGHATGRGRVHHREFKMAVGEMGRDEYITFLTRAFAPLAQYSSKGAIVYSCIDWRHQAEMVAAGRSIFAEPLNCCIWVKDRAGLGSFYRSRHEMVFVWRNGAVSHRNNVQLGQFGRSRTNVWEYPAAATFSRSGEEAGLLQQHPTPKPCALVADAILDSTSRGDIVIDSFLGSGTTIIAAERVGRIGYGIEIDPLYVDLTVRRWQKFTGQRARHAVTGRYFGETDKVAQKGVRHG